METKWIIFLFQVLLIMKHQMLLKSVNGEKLRVGCFKLQYSWEWKVFLISTSTKYKQDKNAINIKLECNQVESILITSSTYSTLQNENGWCHDDDKGRRIYLIDNCYKDDRGKCYCCTRPETVCSASPVDTSDILKQCKTSSCVCDLTIRPFKIGNLCNNEEYYNDRCASRRNCWWRWVDITYDCITKGTLDSSF